MRWSGLGGASSGPIATVVVLSRCVCAEGCCCDVLRSARRVPCVVRGVWAHARWLGLHVRAGVSLKEGW